MGFAAKSLALKLVGEFSPNVRVFGKFVLDCSGWDIDLLPFL
jgi:hypothetical protein